MRGSRIGLAAVTLFLPTILGLPPPAAETGVVEIRLTDEFRFDPADVTVAANTTVRWRNAGTVAWHTVTSYEDRLPEGAHYFDSSGAQNETAARQAPAEGFLRPGEVFEVTFHVIGEYGYFCVPHEGAEMRGVLRVVDRLPDPETSDSTLALAVGLTMSVAVIGAVSLSIRRRRSR
jgi:plastocyanin